MPRYEFCGTATVFVRAFVEADTEEEAAMLLSDEPGIWECEDIEGEVQDIELLGSDENEDV